MVLVFVTNFMVEWIVIQWSVPMIAQTMVSVLMVLAIVEKDLRVQIAQFKHVQMIACLQEVALMEHAFALLDGHISIVLSLLVNMIVELMDFVIMVPVSAVPISVGRIFKLLFV